MKIYVDVWKTLYTYNYNNYNMKSIKERVLEALETWNYQMYRASPYYISREIGASESSVMKVIRILKDDGVIRKATLGHSWVLIKRDVPDKKGVVNDERDN